MGDMGQREWHRSARVSSYSPRSGRSHAPHRLSPSSLPSRLAAASGRPLVVARQGAVFAAPPLPVPSPAVPSVSPARLSDRRGRARFCICPRWLIYKLVTLY